MFQDIQAAIPLGILLSFMIGPVFFVLLETSATKGFRAGLTFDIGVIIADITFILIAYFSSNKLIENLSNQPGLYILGGTTIMVYGITLYFKKHKDEKQIKVKKGSYLSLFLKGYVLNFINVGVLAFWLVVILVVVPSLNNDMNRVLTFFATVILSYLSMDILKILLAKQIRKKLTQAKVRAAKKVLGIILIICGIVIIIKGFIPFDVEDGIQRMEQRINK